MCFVSSVKLEPNTKLGINLRTPYVANTTYVEGNVLESHEKVTGIIFETRLQYENLSPEAEFVLNKLINYFMMGENKDDE